MLCTFSIIHSRNCKCVMKWNQKQNFRYVQSNSDSTQRPQAPTHSFSSPMEWKCPWAVCHVHVDVIFHGIVITLIYISSICVCPSEHVNVCVCVCVCLCKCIWNWPWRHFRWPENAFQNAFIVLCPCCLLFVTQPV